MHRIEGFILAGGQSRRMGTDKWKLKLKGQSFVDRIAGEMAVVASLVTVVGNTSEVLQATRTVPDVYPQWGALGGLHAALTNCSAEWALVVACDLPFVTRNLFEKLASLRDNWGAVAPVQRDQIPQPLCALYRVDPCRIKAEVLISSGERKPIALLQSVPTRWVKFSEIEKLEGAASFFDNINTPQDYDRISR
jgi:molybdopterin-guanine dinucleotide biosynthesis protein A